MLLCEDFNHKFEKVLTYALDRMIPFDNARFLPCFSALNCAASYEKRCSYIKGSCVKYTSFYLKGTKHMSHFSIPSIILRTTLPCLETVIISNASVDWGHCIVAYYFCIAYSISSVVETRERALSFF